ncbi:MRG-binding protein [Capronia coronata CBS 617.96]|uniref:MRG-binding protein n=1 Tax=Capronia coronata CBS 617.96 TaxID=1182541 RepID=W9YZA3_9EURO|nr:MRG-binding protein [Capronia coronata CBS 617.96]EXJ95010.1 MRG-binding protein [Capronia coronata CBS 617.96]
MTSTTSTKSEFDTSLWTDDQESALLQAIVRWKPVGMHKHFRMIAIRESLLNQGVINPEDSHTSMAGIWRKLETLYDLAKLDEREDSIIDGLEDGTKGQSYWREFELPREDFEEMMWQRRLCPDGMSSPAVSRRESTVADTDEPRSSPVPGPTRGSTRATRGGRRGGRLSRLQNEIETDRSSRRTSKAASVAEDQATEDADEEEEDQESEAEEEEEEEESEGPEEGEKKNPAKRTRRGGRRSRGRRGRRR